MVLSSRFQTVPQPLATQYFEVDFSMLRKAYEITNKAPDLWCFALSSERMDRKITSLHLAVHEKRPEAPQVS